MDFDFLKLKEILNVWQVAMEKSNATILISNYKDTINNIEKLTLRAYEAIVFHIK
ncbi:hypothetical protein G9F72_008910 [Clostridium estertheticum]|uniref:hypothetical protein n=1 Tax=Clostridium estertheticum TaxID=238834 RepID=UPI001CD129FE|nr:hypothetical protein [Clostridium estertheticum]MBZ9686448.1 hypothetical protein [Clostridium estertheticum]